MPQRITPIFYAIALAFSITLSAAEKCGPLVPASREACEKVDSASSGNEKFLSLLDCFSTHAKQREETCYAFSSVLSFEAAFYRLEKKKLQLSVDDALANYFLSKGVDATEYKSRRERILRTNGAFFLDGGSPPLLVDQIIKTGYIHPDPHGSSSEYRDMNKQITDWVSDASERGRPAVKKKVLQFLSRRSNAVSTEEFTNQYFLFERAHTKALARLKAAVGSAPREELEGAAIKQAIDECREASAPAVKQILSFLCRGIPVYSGGDVFTLEIARRNVKRLYRIENASGWHAMVIYGVQIDPKTKKPYFLFMNSQQDAVATRLPFDRACTLDHIGAVLLKDELI